MTHHYFIDLEPFLDQKKMSTKKKLIYPNRSLLTLRDGLKSYFHRPYLSTGILSYSLQNKVPLSATERTKEVFWEGNWVRLGSEEP